VGIGTTTPATTFQAGDVLVSGTVLPVNTINISLDVAGGIRGVNFGRLSDSRLKSEVNTIQRSLEKIKALRGVSYLQTTMNENPEERTTFKSMGFIAQEIKEVLPELALLANDGYYAVDYDGVIPVLVEAMKEQQILIEQLQKQITSPQNDNNNLRKSDQIEFVKPLTKNKLEQNIPNPFLGSTAIRYSFIEGNRASLMIFDMNGTTVHKVENLETGEHELVLELSRLASGMYYYSLVVDGAESVTKRMILNK
jgi:trimeric autotransporter adhesin